MTVESALYPPQLNTAWPQSSDMVSEGDNHIRLTKTVIKTTFPNVAGVVSATDIQLSYVTGVTSAIQAQIDSKGAITGQTWTGAHVFGGSAAVPTLAQGANTTGAASTAFVQAEWATRLPNYTAPITANSTELNRLVGVTSGVQSQINAKGAIAGQTWTGTHSFPSTTTVGPLTPTIQGYLSTATSDVQAQINSKAAKAGDTYTGTHNFTGGALKAPTMTAGTATTDVATTAFVASAALAAALPGQTGNAGKVISTDGTNASWVKPVFPTPYTDIAVNTTAVPYGRYRLTASIDLTLPPAPTDGDWVDVVNTSGTTTARVLRNGQNINGLAEDLTLDKLWIALRFVFRTGYGWIIT